MFDFWSSYDNHAHKSNDKPARKPKGIKTVGEAHIPKVKTEPINIKEDPEPIDLSKEDKYAELREAFLNRLAKKATEKHFEYPSDEPDKQKGSFPSFGGGSNDEGVVPLEEAPDVEHQAHDDFDTGEELAWMDSKYKVPTRGGGETSKERKTHNAAVASEYRSKIEALTAPVRKQLMDDLGWKHIPSTTHHMILGYEKWVRYMKKGGESAFGRFSRKEKTRY